MPSTLPRREWMLAMGFALWGLCMAIAMSSILRRPAQPDQPMSVATLANIDAQASMRWMLCLVLFPLIVPAVLRPVSRRLAEGQAWARNAAVIAPIVTLWIVTSEPRIQWTIVPCGLVIVTCGILRTHAMQFTRHDVVLVPVLLTAFVASLDIAPNIGGHQHVIFAASLVLALRIAVTFIRSPMPPALAFVLAPLGLVLQTGFFARDQRYFGWHALAIVIVTPFVLRVFARQERKAVRFLALVTFPIALYAYTNAGSATTAFGKPRLNYFEDGHALMPASEYLRGELPYRDILPGHGLIEDGLFDYAVFRTTDVTAGRALRTREIAGTLTVVALYALAFAATGSVETAFLTALLSVMSGSLTTTIRTLIPVVALALIAAGLRTRRPSWFTWAALATVSSCAMSLDYGFFTCGALLAGMFLAGIRSSIKPVAIGVAAGVVPLFGIFAALGILDDFVRGSFVEIPAASLAYRLGFFKAPAAMQQHPTFPEVAAVALKPEVFQNLVWLVIVVSLGAALTLRRSRRIQPLLVMSVWVALAGVSFAYRFNHYFGMIALAVITGWIFRLVRKRSAFAIVAIAVAIILARPTSHVAVVGVNRAARGTPPPDWVEIRDIPRARGALWHVRDVATIASVKKYVALTLQSHETFFSFTDRAILHYLTRRDWPIREYEIPYLQSEEKQRETIRILEANRNVRAVLMRDGGFSIDYIPNEQRAPILHRYLLEHFAPDFEEGDVTFWRRKE